MIVRARTFRAWLEPLIPSLRRARLDTGLPAAASLPAATRAWTWIADGTRHRAEAGLAKNQHWKQAGSQESRKKLLGGTSSARRRDNAQRRRKRLHERPGRAILLFAATHEPETRPRTEQSIQRVAKEEKDADRRLRAAFAHRRKTRGVIRAGNTVVGSTFVARPAGT